MEIVAHTDEKYGTSRVTQIRFGDGINGTIVFEMKKNGQPVVYGIAPKIGAMLLSDFWLMQGNSFELFCDRLQQRSALSIRLASTMSVLVAVSIACNSFPGTNQAGRTIESVEGVGEVRDTQEIPLHQVPMEVLQSVENSCVKVVLKYKGENGETVTSFSSGTITEAVSDLIIATVGHSLTNVDDPSTKEKESYIPVSVSIEYNGHQLPAVNFSDAADFKTDAIKDFGVIGINLSRLQELAGESLPEFKAVPVNPNWFPRIFDPNTPATPLIFCGYVGRTNKKEIEALTLPVVKNPIGLYQPKIPQQNDRSGRNLRFEVTHGTKPGKSGGGIFTYENGNAQLVGVVTNDIIGYITLCEYVSGYHELRSQLRTKK